MVFSAVKGLLLSESCAFTTDGDYSDSAVDERWFDEFQVSLRVLYMLYVFYSSHAALCLH